MNVFVLCTGRCGSMTFAKACSHITNFTSAHESRTNLVGPARLSFPTNHIEIDNRLSWHLGELGQRFPDAYYIHLERNREEVAKSFEKRWGRGIIGAFSQGIIQSKPGVKVKQAFCGYYVDTVNLNIREFLSHRKHIKVQLASVKTDFLYFWQELGAEGNLNKALAEWDQRYNKS